MQPGTGNLTPIFAMPFASLQLPGADQLNPQLQSLLAGRANAEHASASLAQSPLLFQSRDDLFDWPEPPVQQLRAQLLRAIATVVASCNDYTEQQFGELGMHSRAHFTRVLPDGFMPTTSYSQAPWCAVYCVTAPELSGARPLNGVLQLYETRLANALIDASNWRLKQPFEMAHHVWRPTPGYVAIFPAFLPHQVTFVQGRGSLLLVITRARFSSPGQTDLPPW